MSMFKFGKKKKKKKNYEMSSDPADWGPSCFTPSIQSPRVAHDKSDAETPELQPGKIYYGAEATEDDQEQRSESQRGKSYDLNTDSDLLADLTYEMSRDEIAELVKAQQNDILRLQSEAADDGNTQYLRERHAKEIQHLRDQLTAAKEESKRKSKNTEGAFADRAEISRLQQENDRLKNELKLVVSNLESPEKRVSDAVFARQLSARNEEISLLKQQMAVLINEKSKNETADSSQDLRTELERAHQEIDALHRAAGITVSEKGTMKDRATLAAEVELKTTVMNQLGLKIAALENTLQAVRFDGALEATIDDVVRLENENEDLRRIIKETSSEEIRLRESARIAQEALVNANNKIESTGKANVSHIAQYSALLAQAQDSLDSLRAEMGRERQQHKEQITKLSNEIQMLRYRKR